MHCAMHNRCATTTEKLTKKSWPVWLGARVKPRDMLALTFITSGILTESVRGGKKKHKKGKLGICCMNCFVNMILTFLKKKNSKRKLCRFH